MYSRKHGKYGKDRKSLTHYVMSKYSGSSLDEEKVGKIYLQIIHFLFISFFRLWFKLQRGNKLFF